MAGPVPVARSLQDIYTDDALASQGKRWNELLSKFEAKYGHAAQFVARSPGRVNIIGEHIDYSMYSVLPMAISADALLAVSTDLAPANEGTFKIQISNLQDAKFPPREFDVPLDEVPIDATIHEWSNYFKCGLRGALELLRKKKGADFRPKSMQIMLDGTVPSGGGLSSSAAFVSASALAVMVANGEQTVDKTELTELAIVSERSVGVNSGGMDQSASVFSQRGSALFVSFTPALTARPVQFPKTNPELTFLIAQSFVSADKYVTGPVQYNLRVVECTLAAAYLNAVLNPPSTRLPADKSPLAISLQGFHETYFALLEGTAPKTVSEQLEELLTLVKSTLVKEEGYTREEIAAAIGLTTDELNAQFTSRFPVRAERFKLRQRALHVYSEALRVLQVMALLEDPAQHPADGADTSDYNAKLGALLNATQDSCRDVYECSCPEIDELCTIARRAGSYGSRLTGAGWGGCSVHLVPADKVAAVKEAWEKEYYAKKDLTPEQRAAAIVVSKPGNDALESPRNPLTPARREMCHLRVARQSNMAGTCHFVRHTVEQVSVHVLRALSGRALNIPHRPVLLDLDAPVLGVERSRVLEHHKQAAANKAASPALLQEASRRATSGVRDPRFRCERADQLSHPIGNDGVHQRCDDAVADLGQDRRATFLRLVLVAVAVAVAISVTVSPALLPLAASLLTALGTFGTLGAVLHSVVLSPGRCCPLFGDRLLGTLYLPILLLATEDDGGRCRILYSLSSISSLILPLEFLGSIDLLRFVHRDCLFLLLILGVICHLYYQFQCETRIFIPLAFLFVVIMVVGDSLYTQIGLYSNLVVSVIAEKPPDSTAKSKHVGKGAGVLLRLWLLCTVCTVRSNFLSCTTGIKVIAHSGDVRAMLTKIEAGRQTKLPKGGKARMIVMVGPMRDMTQSFRLNIQNGFQRSRGTERRFNRAPFDVNHLAVGKEPAKMFVAISPYQADPAMAPLERKSRSMIGDMRL
ncbi:Galactokinase [Thozetella sp. PMI_491]|nr:Galactokinase [Thozetella sp. PMI_491]